MSEALRVTLAGMYLLFLARDADITQPVRDALARTRFGLFFRTLLNCVFCTAFWATMPITVFRLGVGDLELIDAPIFHLGLAAGAGLAYLPVILVEHITSKK